MATVTREFELRPCTAIDRIGRRVVFAQDEIFLNGRRIGYVGHTPGEQASLIAPVDKETADGLKAFIAESRNGVAPCAIYAAPVIEDREEGGDDE